MFHTLRTHYQVSLYDVTNVKLTEKENHKHVKNYII